jgi:RIO-like serine/threonine protein kinase
MLIQLPNKGSGPKGGYGTYFKITRSKGVKVLRGSFSSFLAAMNSGTMKLAMKERDLMNEAHSSGVTPKCFGVTVVQRGNSFRVGIIMEHLGSVRLRDLKMDEEEEERIIMELEEQVSSAGVTHNDLHPWNVMVKGDKYYAIDFSPDYAYSHEEREAA